MFLHFPFPWSRPQKCLRQKKKKMYTHALSRFTILLHIRLLFLGTLRFLVIWDVEIFIHHYRSMKISTEPHDQSLVLQKEDLSPACQVINCIQTKTSETRRIKARSSSTQKALRIYRFERKAKHAKSVVKLLPITKQEILQLRRYDKLYRL